MNKDSSRKPMRPVLTFAIVIAWGVLVIGGVRLAEAAVRLWQQQVDTLQVSRRQLGRLQGWVQVQDQVSARRDALFEMAGHVELKDLTWLSLQGIQQVAHELNLSIEELRPSYIAGRKNRSAQVRLDVKMVGELAAISDFLQRLPESVVWAKLESVRLAPGEGQEIQALLRLSLSEV